MSSRIRPSPSFYTINPEPEPIINNPTSLLWAYQLRVEHKQLSQRLAGLVNDTKATASSSARVAEVSYDRLNTAISNLRQELRNEVRVALDKLQVEVRQIQETREMVELRIADLKSWNTGEIERIEKITEAGHEEARVLRDMIETAKEEIFRVRRELKENSECRCSLRPIHKTFIPPSSPPLAVQNAHPILRDRVVTNFSPLNQRSVSSYIPPTASDISTVDHAPLVSEGSLESSEGLDSELTISSRPRPRTPSIELGDSVSHGSEPQVSGLPTKHRTYDQNKQLEENKPPTVSQELLSSLTQGSLSNEEYLCKCAAIIQQFPRRDESRVVQACLLGLARNLHQVEKVLDEEGWTWKVFERALPRNNETGNRLAINPTKHVNTATARRGNKVMKKRRVIPVIWPDGEEEIVSFHKSRNLR